MSDHDSVTQPLCLIAEHWNGEVEGVCNRPREHAGPHSDGVISWPPTESKIWSCPRRCGFHIANPGAPMSVGDIPTSELIQEHMEREHLEYAWPTDPYAAERAAYVAGLRELADWWEQHTEIAPPRWPSIEYQPAFHGDAGSVDDAEGIARVEQMAAAFGVNTRETDSGHIVADLTVGTIRVHAAYVPSRRMQEHEQEQETLREIKAARTASAVLTPDAELTPVATPDALLMRPVDPGAAAVILGNLPNLPVEQRRAILGAAEHIPGALTA